MRISDWSSDVCSSDLANRFGDARHRFPRLAHGPSWPADNRLWQHADPPGWQSRQATQMPGKQRYRHHMEQAFQPADAPLADWANAMRRISGGQKPFFLDRKSVV